MIVSKLNSELIGNLLYLRNVENITKINNKKMNSLTIRKYHKTYEFGAYHRKICNVLIR
jgi:hypothetical protein